MQRRYTCSEHSLGVQNIEALNAILRQGAQPWWNLYGGKDHLDIVDSFSLKRSLKSESGQ